MTQRIVIHLLPIEIFLLCLGAGWLAVMGVRGLDLSAGAYLPAAQLAQAAAGALARPGAAGSAPSAPALSPVFTPEVQHWAPQIEAWAALFQLDPNLIATVMQIESCGAPGVVSGSGAQGLFQVMPFHFTAGEDMQDPDTNAARGLAYLALGLQRSAGNVGLALAGYNGGHSQIGKDSSLWPDQTQRYWYWGTGIYAEASSGAADSTRLQEWLSAGGASLCRTAAAQVGLAPAAAQ
ncbi:MAG: transglycosylase SLT domain-containing protein [Anaerolineales bacterium]|nr:transglycosylase SLT domain-containing protein [Anaerolineales bacterium]